jgi:hypothetical protein
MSGMRGWRICVGILAVVTMASGCGDDQTSRSDSAGRVGEGVYLYQLHQHSGPLTDAGLSSAATACRQMAAHRYLRAAKTINLATAQHTVQWRDLAQAVRTIAWSKSWAGDIGPRMSRDVAVQVIQDGCSQVRSQGDGSSFTWSP